MNKYLIVIAFVFSSVKCFSQADSVKQYVDSSLVILKNNSLYSKNVDWTKITKQVHAKAKSAKTKSATFEALKIAFDALKDKHAAYYQYEDQYKLENAELTARISDSLKAAWKRGLKINKKMIGDMAYISIPTLGVGKQADIDKYANWIYDAVRSLNEKKPKGWIVDLRMNGGGNIRPMLAGLAMFFDDGVYTYYIDRDGKASDESGFKEGDFVIDGKIQANVLDKMKKISNAKIAILIGPGTASSGEGVAVVFSQKQNVKSFGTDSAGLANATNGFVFNKNLSYYLLSVAKIADKNHKIYPEIVKPDVYVNQNESFANLPNDPAVKEAIKWLAN
ncbi:MAG: S41 family peptidase [Flavobacterium sp.]